MLTLSDDADLARAWAVQIMRQLSAWASSCFAKERFDSSGLAHSVARRVGRRHRGMAQPYRCRFCRGYHIGRPS